MTDEIIEQANDLWSQGNEDEAIDLLMPLAEGGHIVAKAALGLLLCHYLKNNEFPKLEDGAKLLLEACNAGEASACHNLGTLWLGHSPAIGKDIRKAASFYLKARELGGPIAEEGFYQEWERVLNG